jgi:Domain of unknown function (DUF4126)
MDSLVFVTGFGLAAAVGLNVTVPLLLAGVLTRVGVFHPAHALAFIGSDLALTLLGVAASIEIVVAKTRGGRRALHLVLLPPCVAVAVLLSAAADLPAASGGALVAPLFLGALAAGGLHVGRAVARPAVRVTGLTLPVSWAEDVASALLALGAVTTPVLVLVGAGAVAAIGTRWLIGLFGLVRLLRDLLSGATGQG